MSYLSHEKPIVSVEPFICTRLMSTIRSPDTFAYSSFSVRLHRLPSCVTRLVLCWFRKPIGRHTISTVERRAFISWCLHCGARRSKELPWGGRLLLSSRGGCWPYRWQCLVRWSYICDWLRFSRSLQHCQILLLRHRGKSIFNLFNNKREKQFDIQVKQMNDKRGFLCWLWRRTRTRKKFYGYSNRILKGCSNGKSYLRVVHCTAALY